MNKSKFQADVTRRLALRNGKLTGIDFAELTVALLEESPTESGDPAAIDDADNAELTLIYGPRRDLQRARIETLAEKHGIVLDEETNGVIDLMLNPGVFLHQMAGINFDGKPLLVKESKLKKKDKMKALFAPVADAPAHPETQEAEPQAPDAPAVVEKPAPAQPTAAEPAPKK